jgi:hypothetical protein
MEFSEFFSNSEEEIKFFSQNCLKTKIEVEHKETLEKVNQSDAILDIYKDVSMKEVLNIFFSNIKEVVIVRTDN